MKRRISVLLVPLVALTSLLSLGPVSSAEATTPGAGKCSDSTGSWVCNVDGQTLRFDTVGGVTQDGSSIGTTDHFTAATGGTLAYQNVFSDGDTIIDASLKVEDNTSIDRIDSDVNPGDIVGNPESIAVYNDSSTGSTEFTVSFFERSSGLAVTLLNVDIVVKDLDGPTQKEFAVFEGLSSYTTSSTTKIRVSTDSTATYPTSEPGDETPTDTGLRQFGGEDGTSTPPEDYIVLVEFDSVSQIGFFAGTRGSRGYIGFTFAPTSFTSPSTQTVSPGEYDVVYDKDGGDGTAPASVTTTQAITLSSGSGLSKGGVNISAWSTLPSGNGVKYPLNSSYLPVKDVTLYAVYEANTVTFNANGGSGADYTQVASGPTALSANSFSRSGYDFASWNTAPDGTGASYANGASFPFASDDTLYAQWSIATVSAATGIFLYLAGRPGSPVEGSTVYYGSVSIKPNTTYILSIQSVTNPALTRTVLATGTTNDWGHSDNRLEMGELDPGTYKVVMTGTHRLGYPLVLTNYISVAGSGNFISLSPESLQPTLD